MSVLGIDIGGSGIKGAPVDVTTGEFLQERIRIPTPDPGTPEQVVEVIKHIIEEFNWQGKIGVGFPGLILRGVVHTAANMSPEWVGVDLAELIQSQTGCPAVVLNDADAAGLAEMRFGSGKRFEDSYVIFLTIGTGIGSAFFLKKEIWPNAELGHLEIRGKDAEHRAGDGVRKEKELSWKQWGKRLSEVLQTYDFLFSPDAIILGGGVSKQFDRFSKYLTGIRAEVLPAELQNQAGIVGAAMAAEEALSD